MVDGSRAAEGDRAADTEMMLRSGHGTEDGVPDLVSSDDASRLRSCIFLMDHHPTRNSLHGSCHRW